MLGEFGIYSNQIVYLQNGPGVPMAEDQEDGSTTKKSKAGSSIKDGDIVEMTCTVRAKSNGILIDTTEEKVAEEEGVDTKNQKWGPRKVVIGEKHVFISVEESMRETGIGKLKTVSIAAADAFGEYDAEWVKTVSIDKIPKDDRHPGVRTTIDNHQVQIETLIGGRARVNFNHPLAGEDIEYEYEINRIIEDPEEKVSALVEMYVGVELENHIETEGDDGKTLYINSVPELSYNQNWLFTKRQIATELIEKIGVDRVVIKEVFEKIEIIEEE
jgi:FKBP-type peptidyl-prolyl cis-trans isomerase SlyD